MTRLPLLPGQENWACTVPFCWAPAECRIEDGGVAGRPVCDFHAYEKIKGVKMADEQANAGEPMRFDESVEMTEADWQKMADRLGKAKMPPMSHASSPTVAEQLIEGLTELADRIESGERVHAQEIPWEAADFWDSVHDHLTLDHGVQPADAAAWINEYKTMFDGKASPSVVAEAIMSQVNLKAVADGLDPPTLWACDGCGRALTPAGEHRWVCENPKCAIQTVAW